MEATLIQLRVDAPLRRNSHFRTSSTASIPTMKGRMQPQTGNGIGAVRNIALPRGDLPPD